MLVRISIITAPFTDDDSRGRLNQLAAIGITTRCLDSDQILNSIGVIIGVKTFK
jgi:hypothetical protein